MKKGSRASWSERFESPVEEIWQVLADTARFNEAAELPKHEVQEIPQRDGSVRYIGQARMGPFQLLWEDEPANWVENQWFRHCLHFLKGPLKSLCATLRFYPDAAGCRGEYTIEVAPANLLGRMILAMGFVPSAGKTFVKLAESARDFVEGRRAVPFDYPTPKLAAGTRERAAELVQRIERTPFGHGLARRLADYVLNQQDIDARLIRPLKLARVWKVPERIAIELCLEAVRQGLLGLRWELLCPRCQVGKESVPALDRLPQGAHCPSCNIDYERDFSNNVELTFYPSKAIRDVGGGEYCLFSPMDTPHIKLQVTVAPGESKTLPITMSPGVYRARTLEPGDEQTVDCTGTQFPRVIADGTSITTGASCNTDELILENRTDRKLTYILEEHAWKRDVLTASRVTALQAFRDLFSEDVLRPGDHVEIDYITLMFTDLQGSTALYDRIGDPQAYALVREHYAIIGKTVREHNGTIVKTIGDAVMGAYIEPVDAFHCALQLHDEFAEFNIGSGKEPVMIKLGLHAGRCISVTLNNRLDYYGSAANKAARLESQSQGGDIVLSKEFAEDPGIAPLLKALSPIEEQAQLRGFTQPIDFVRITAEELSRRRRTKRPDDKMHDDGYLQTVGPGTSQKAEPIT